MQHFRLSLITSLFLLIFATATAYAKAPPGYSLVWSDEFKKPTIDANEWKYREGPGSHSFQQAANVTIQKDGLHVAEKQEMHGKFQYTGGGVITQRGWKYGYFETNARAGGSGWHEAFWSTDGGSVGDKSQPQKEDSIEIDGFEHDNGGWPTVLANGLSFGVIKWLPSGKGANLLRRFPDNSFDLRSEFHTFGYECQPGFIRFYIDGHAVGICDMRDCEEMSSHVVWLSAIATHADAQPGEAVFKYLRVYTADAEMQKQRCREAYSELDELRGKTQSKGTDLWIDAISFTNRGGWTNDIQQGEKCLIGHRGKAAIKSDSDRYASMRIQVPVSGQYHLWVRSYEPDMSQHSVRFFNVELGGIKADKVFGKSTNPGWNWESGGKFNLPAGPLTVRFYDSSAYFARPGRILLTTDLNFSPNGVGGRENVKSLP